MTPADVRVFSFDLDVPAGVAAELDALLRGRRNGRAASASASPRRDPDAVGARAANAEPARWTISRDCAHCGHPSHGRPTVVGADISFSLSHSGAFARSLAVTGGGIRVGVDVEASSRAPRLDALAARVLSEPRARGLARRSPTSAIDSCAFLRAWTAREAYLKALGIGIVTAPARRAAARRRLAHRRDRRGRRVGSPRSPSTGPRST